MWGSILQRVISHHQSRRLSTTTSGGGPWLMLPPARSGNMAAYKLYSPVKGQVVSFNINGNDEAVEVMQDPTTRLVGSSHGWLALFNRRRNAFFLSNPLSGRRIGLPPPPDVPPIKVIVSSSPDDDDCRALMLSGTCNSPSFCRPGRSCAWTPIGGRSCVRNYAYADIVYSAAQKRFLCVLKDKMYMYDSDKGEVERWDLECWNVLEEPTMDWKAESLDFQFYKQTSDVSCHKAMRYLVADDRRRQIYLVTRYFNFQIGAPPYRDYDWDDIYPDKTFEFHVHRIGKGVAPRYMEGSLDGLVMFVGVNHSFALPASEFPELQPDSIYYTHNTVNFPDGVYGGHDLGIFDYRNKTRSPCYYPCDFPSFKKIHPPPIWYTPTPTAI